MADADYCAWLVGQPWFKSRFGNVYNVVVQYGTDTFDTPEHNGMQAAFLDDDACWRLAKQVLPETMLAAYDADRVRALASTATPAAIHRYIGARIHSAAVAERQFEVDGWDVVYRLTPSIAEILLKEAREIPECVCDCQHNDCPEHAKCQGGEESYACEHRSCANRAPIDLEGFSSGRVSEQSYAHCSPACPWHDQRVWQWIRQLGGGNEHGYRYVDEFVEDRLGHRSVYVECKPDLGDDYPGVLRQVARYPVRPSRVRVVLVRRFASEAVSWEQAVKIFAASEVELVRESDVRQQANHQEDQ
jgi:hypothetical protein